MKSTVYLRYVSMTITTCLFDCIMLKSFDRDIATLPSSHRMAIMSRIGGFVISIRVNNNISIIFDPMRLRLRALATINYAVTFAGVAVAYSSTRPIIEFQHVSEHRISPVSLSAHTILISDVFTDFHVSICISAVTIKGSLRPNSDAIFDVISHSIQIIDNHVSHW